MESTRVVFEGRTYKFLTEEDIKLKEFKNAQHLSNLKGCIKYLKNLEAFVDQLKKERVIIEKWQEYINCIRFPKPYKPPDIRFFIERLKRDEIASNQQTVSWLLSVDDRSILSQDFGQEDLTYSTLKHKDKTKFSSFYDKDIDEYLKILQRIDDFMDDSPECSTEKLEDIKELTITIRQEIVELINRFTYRILSSEEAYMDSLDAITAEYNFEGNNFQIHIWSLKNVPIRFDRLEATHFKANLHGVKIILSIPINIMNEKFAIRALHMNFVHISTSDHVFSQEVIEPPEFASFEFKDLPECLEGEWEKQLEIQNQIQSKMIRARDEYFAENKHLEDEKAKAQNKVNENEILSDRKRKKIAKELPTPDVSNVTDDMIPDVREMFLEEERKQFKSYVDSLYNPSLKEFTSDEINLKKYAILGGVYQLYQVEKPKHFEFKSFNITNHCNDAKLVIDTDFTISSPYVQRSSLKRTSVFIKEPRRSLSSKVDYLAARDCPWFVLAIELPEYLCYWGEPIVCQYETITKVAAKPIVPTENKQVQNVSGEQLRTSQQSKEAIDKEAINPMPLVKYLPFLAPHKEGLTESVLKIEKLSTENFLSTSLSNIHQAQEDHFTYRAVDSEGIINIHDFPLNSVLSKTEINHIARHVVPRMLSTFKFNKDIKEEEELKALESTKSKGKGALGILKRKRSTEADIQKSQKKESIFKIGGEQNLPERLIPIFTPEEPIRFLQLQNDIQDPEAINREIKSFAQLVALINFIKWWHKTKVRQLIDLPNFKPKIALASKRLRREKKQKKLSVSYISSEPIGRSFFRLRTVKSVYKRRVGSKGIPEGNSEDRGSNSPTISTDSSTSTKQSESEENFIKYTYSYWTTKNIFKSEYNKEKRTFIIQTNKLGYFGLAFKLYRHFPFTFWKLEPNPDDPENEVIFTLETQCVRCIFNINEKGIRCVVTDITKTYVRNMKKYFLIDEPLDNMKKLKQVLRDKNINIFADNDASFYIENGMFSEKHLATERHSYRCMAINCTQIKFCYSTWNRLADKRDLILKFMQYQDIEDNMTEARLTPEQAYFIETTELCSDDLKVIKLKFNLTWRNLGFYSDLQSLINSMYPAVDELKCKNAMLLLFVQNLLFEIRPLSFS